MNKSGILRPYFQVISTGALRESSNVGLLVPALQDKSSQWIEFSNSAGTQDIHAQKKIKDQ
jgi:hypothetical protein